MHVTQEPRQVSKRMESSGFVEKKATTSLEASARTLELSERAATNIKKCVIHRVAMDEDTEEIDGCC